MVGNSCHFSCFEEESIHHLFFSCPLGKVAWFVIFLFSSHLHLQTNDLPAWLKYTLSSLEDGEKLLKGVIIFLNEIWRKRNMSAHGGKISNPHES